MKRDKLNDLIQWKNSTNRKPLLIRGARQVGKTWLMKELGKNYYKQYVYVNFEKNKRLKLLFKENFNPDRIIQGLQIESGLRINSDNTLLIFDEIQESPEALTSLKYFQEDAPDYHIIAAGSLLGVAMHSGSSFPVGKIAFMDMYPLSFPEFLNAMEEDSIVNLLQSGDWELIAAFKSRLINRLRQYYYVGGMPEAVAIYAENSDLKAVRSIQKQILSAYEQDFSKHTPATLVPRIRMAWNSLPAQLTKENKKFVYGLIKDGARAREYELALTWLIDCGLAHKIHRVSKPNIPLKAYEDPGAFKLFIVDVGLLAALTDLDDKTLIMGNEIFTEFKGALTEQFVLQQLVSTDKYKINYWSAKLGTAEVDFVLQYNDSVIPLEVKAEENLHSKSLKVYHEKFNPSIAIRTSMSDYRKRDWLCNFPLYAINSLNQEI
ncbi:MAG: ATP-binding protein [Desulfatiglandales bacterium]